MTEYEYIPQQIPTQYTIKTYLLVKNPTCRTLLLFTLLKTLRLRYEYQRFNSVQENNCYTKHTIALCGQIARRMLKS
jgi:hypothetical protein